MASIPRAVASSTTNAANGIGSTEVSEVSAGPCRSLIPAPRRASEKNLFRRPRTHRPCFETQAARLRSRRATPRSMVARARPSRTSACRRKYIARSIRISPRAWGPSCSRASSGAPAASFQPLPTADCGAPKPVACRSDTIARRASLHCEVHHTVGSWHPGSLAAPVRHHLRPEQVAAFPVGSGEATEERT